MSDVYAPERLTCPAPSARVLARRSPWQVRKEFWLDPKSLRRAQTDLGTAIERETVERALDLDPGA